MRAHPVALPATNSKVILEGKTKNLFKNESISDSRASYKFPVKPPYEVEPANGKEARTHLFPDPMCGWVCLQAAFSPSLCT